MINFIIDRSQVVVLENKISNLRKITNGLLQGFVLEPLFFIIYINDFYKLVSLKKLLLADDETALYYSKKFVSLLRSLKACQFAPNQYSSTTIKSKLVSLQNDEHVNLLRYTLDGRLNKVDYHPSKK